MCLPIACDAERRATIVWSPMITVTRLNQKSIAINADVIRSIEENPDTTITLINGDHIIVRETMRDVIEKVIEYGRHLRRLQPPS